MKSLIFPIGQSLKNMWDQTKIEVNRIDLTSMAFLLAGYDGNCGQLIYVLKRK